MWNNFDKATEDELGYLAAVGRALSLAQNFEFVCKRVLSVFDVVKSIEGGDTVDLDYWAKHLDEYVEDRLADAVRKYGKAHGISADEVSVLDIARRARNYIAHEGALLWFGVPSESANMQSRIYKLRDIASDLAAAHNLVCGWAYSIEEKEPPPFTVTTRHEPMAIEWIMQPVEEMLRK